MKTTIDVLKEMLLSGRHITKFDFLRETNSVCLTQRIYDIEQKEGWKILRKSVEGKGNLLEYWLPEEEITRITNRNISKPESAKYKHEQPALGVFGSSQWW